MSLSKFSFFPCTLPLIYIDGISLLKFSDDSKLSLYADDMLLYKVISSNADYIHLQHDIDRIQNWSSDNLMSFNVSKCKCMLISRKPHMNYPCLTLSGEYLEIVKWYKYLSLLLSSNLSWSTHIDSICIKVRKLLGLLHRQFSANTNSCTLTKLYLSLIRPHLEYGAQVWHPYVSKDIYTSN